MATEVVELSRQFQSNASKAKQRREYDQQARNFVFQLSNVSLSHWQKGADTPQDILTVLDPAHNSIAYAFALRQRIHASFDRKNISDNLKPGGVLWNKLVLWLETFDPVQMRYAGPEWKRLVEATEEIARAVGSPGLAIAPIRSAMIRLDPTTGTFTSIHLNFIRLCMETRSYTAAIPILDNYIHSIPTRIPIAVREELEYSVPCADVVSSGDYIHQDSNHSDKVTLLALQEYYLLGSMAYLGVRQFKKARNMLEHVLIAPSVNVANGLMLEAYKKWVLVSCLVNVTDGVTPQNANGTAMKQVRSASKAYEALAEAYQQFDNLAKLQAQVNAGRHVWAEDGNTGLVKEVVESQRRASVSRLSRTYSAIPVSNMSSSLGRAPDEVAQYLESLIAGGYLNARLEPGDEASGGAVLRFFLDPAQGPLAKTEKQQQQALYEQTLRTKMLAEQVKDADYRLSLTKEYCENAKRANKKQSGGGDAMDTTWDDGVDVEEEDIMVGRQ